jgi:hypothetical protein
MTQAKMTTVEMTDDMKTMLDLFKQDPQLSPDRLPEGWDDKRARATLYALDEAGYDAAELPTRSGDFYWVLRGNYRGVGTLTEDGKAILDMIGGASRMLFPENLPEGWDIARVRAQHGRILHAGFPIMEHWTPDGRPFWGFDYSRFSRITASMK